MLPSLGFEGTAKVVNKGVDVTLITDTAGKDELFQVSRTLVVCGISAAVVEVTELDPVDMKTIRYFEDTTPILVFFDQNVSDAVIPLLRPETQYRIIRETNAAQLLKELPPLIKKAKEKNLLYAKMAEEKNQKI